MESTTRSINVTLFLNVVTTVWEKAETTKDTFMEEVESYIIFKIGNFLATYYYPVLIPVGMVGNILSFLIMIKPSYRIISTCIYLAAISINDNIMMYMICHDYLLSDAQIHQFECNLLAFVASFALQNGTFVVVAMTLDKYIAVLLKGQN